MRCREWERMKCQEALSWKMGIVMEKFIIREEEEFISLQGDEIVLFLETIIQITD